MFAWPLRLIYNFRCTDNNIPHEHTPTESRTLEQIHNKPPVNLVSQTSKSQIPLISQSDLKVPTTFSSCILTSISRTLWYLKVFLSPTELKITGFNRVYLNINDMPNIPQHLYTNYSERFFSEILNDSICMHPLKLKLHCIKMHSWTSSLKRIFGENIFLWLTLDYLPLK